MEESNKIIEEIYNNNPLLIFSGYTQFQVDIVRKLGNEILSLLDASMGGRGVQATGFNAAYGKYWLWILGSYEVVRVMTDNPSGAPSCFSPRILPKLLALKSVLADVRMPLAKQQLRGKKNLIVGSEPSFSAVDTTKRDAAFEINGRLYWIRETIAHFEDVFTDIARSDVLKDLRDGKSLRPVKES